MKIQFVEIQNFRKLRSVRIDFAPERTVFVGANNSGKTSAMAALRLFLANQGGFTLNDFTLSKWEQINRIGQDWEVASEAEPPSDFSWADWMSVAPSLDLWLEVGDDEIHHVRDLLPTLDWEGGLLGVRLRFEPKSVEELYKEYVSAIRKARETLRAAKASSPTISESFALWPRGMVEFLERRLRTFFSIRAYVLDPKKQEAPQDGLAQPQTLPMEFEPLSGEPLKGLIRIDVIHAHREFADVSSPQDQANIGERRYGRRLSGQLRSYYDAHLNPLETPEPSDVEALQAIQEAERLFDLKLRTYFSGALGEVEGLGYPGVTDPKLTIATKMHLTDGLNHDAAVQYDVIPGDGATGVPLRLPEECNGLGYQNLISIVFTLMAFRDSWMKVGKASKAEVAKSYSPPPLHLVLIEEPEAHLHAQVQQVFIRRAYELLRNHTNLGSNPKLWTQLVVSTHSGHVAIECQFSWLRYFRRKPAGGPGDVPEATVVNLSEVFGTVADTQRFVTRYLKAVHADLFFADAAILVEGPSLFPIS